MTVMNSIEVIDLWKGVSYTLALSHELYLLNNSHELPRGHWQTKGKIFELVRPTLDVHSQNIPSVSKDGNMGVCDLETYGLMDTTHSPWLREIVILSGVSIS